MNVILLSGGSGKRLWPLSNDIRSKQFIKIFDNNGVKESMVQRMYRGIKNINADAKIVLATSKTQVSELRNQLGEDVLISVEPSRRDTFPAIALSVSFLHDLQNVSDEETVVVCPIDPFVEDDYFGALEKLNNIAKKDDSNLVLMGIKPTNPSEKYGYIIPKTKQEVSKVKVFKEKPDAVTAKKYISQGALWNSGIFAFKVGYLLKRAHELIGFKDYNDLYNKYDELTKISFDYAVSEKEKNIAVLKFNGTWEDLGTWSSLTNVMTNNCDGNVVFKKNKNSHVLNELDIPIVCLGARNMIVAASPEGILVSSLKESDNIKNYVGDFAGIPMFAEKSWGSYKVIDVQKSSVTRRVLLTAGHEMTYHYHKRRDEVWMIVSGQGEVILDGSHKVVNPGDIVKITAGHKHTVKAIDDLIIIEVQIGDYIDVKDKQKCDL